MIRVMAVLLALASLTTSTAGPSTHGDAQTIAKAQDYLSAYARLDLKTLEILYAEDAVFNDPTSTKVPGIGGPFVWHGRNENLANIGERAKSIKSLEYDVERVYEASGHVVFVGDVKPLTMTCDGPVLHAYPIVTIVTIEGGRVTEHRDYTNYAAGHVVSALAK